MTSESQSITETLMIVEIFVRMIGNNSHSWSVFFRPEHNFCNDYHGLGKVDARDETTSKSWSKIEYLFLFFEDEGLDKI